MKKNSNSVCKDNAKITVDFQINVVETRNGKTTVQNHMDGKFSLTAEQMREVIRVSVASALKGAAESLDEEEEKEENIEE